MYLRTSKQIPFKCRCVIFGNLETGAEGEGRGEGGVDMIPADVKCRVFCPLYLARAYVGDVELRASTI